MEWQRQGSKMEIAMSGHYRWKSGLLRPVEHVKKHSYAEAAKRIECPAGLSSCGDAVTKVLFPRTALAWMIHQEDDSTVMWLPGKGR